MNTNFSNGLIYSWDRKNNNLVYSNNTVSIKIHNNKPIIASFAHGPRDYYQEISTGSWSITTTEKTWLLARLDNFTGRLELVTSTISPENCFGAEFPENPTIGDFFFNHLLNRMFTWTGYKWLNIIQVTIGYVENEKTYPSNTGTQVSLNKVAKPAAILRDQNQLPLIKLEDNLYNYFLTENDNINSKNKKTGINNFKYGRLYYYLIAGESIPAYSLISIDENGNAINATNTSNNPVKRAIGMSVQAAEIDGIVKFVTSGEVTNKSWVLPFAINSKIFLDYSGNFTSLVNTEELIQCVGRVINPNTIELDTTDYIIMNPTMTPSVTPSLTPTITPTISITPTVTPTVTPTITPTTSITPSVTATITPTVTPTVTP